MGKGGGGGGQTTSTVTNTNIPEYARGYVENMLGATQHQLFNTTTNPTTGETELGSLRPYQAYGGTYDSSGNMTSYDPSAAIAGFTPMQQMAQNGIYNMQMPGQFDAASGYTADAMQRAANAGYNPGQFTMGEAYAPDVNYYQMNQPQDVRGENAQGAYLGDAPTAYAQTGSASRLGFAPTIDNADQMYAAQLGNAPTYQGQQLSYTPQDIGYDRVTAPQLRDLQMQAAGNVSTGSFTQPGAAQSYMSPYIQNVVDIEKREAQRQADIAGTKRGSQFAQAGAFGGSRQAIENAEAARNLATQQGDIQAKGLQSAFQSAQGQFNTEQQAQLQAALANQQVEQQTGVQNLSALLQTQGLGAQTGLTAQQLNQAAGVDTSKFNQQQQYNTSLQNAQMLQQQQLANQSLEGQYGLTQAQMEQAANASNQAANNQRLLANQGVLSQYGLTQGQMDQQMGMANLANRQQTALANQALSGQYGLTQGQLSQANNQFNAQQNQGANLSNQQMAYNTNLQNLQANLGVQQLGAGQNMQSQLANQQARLSTQQAIEQSRQFGANYGQQMNAQQLAAAQQLAGIGGQQLTAQQGIYGLQNQIGGQQQQYQQQIINQSMQDYANAQQYPMMQLGTMSNMLRGLPMQASTTNMYQAAPNALTQGIGAVGAYGALNGAFGGAPTGRKEGGVIHAAKGGIMSYDVGGEIESTLSKMDVDDLKRYAKESSSPSIKQMAARLIQEKSTPVPRMARGGILAFAKSTDENNQSLVEGEDKKYGGWPSWLYNPGEALSNINPLRAMADRHAESFGTKLSAPPPAAAPAESAPPPAALTNPSAITSVPTAGPAPAPVPRAAPAPAAPPVTAQAVAPVARPAAPRPSAPPAPATPPVGIGSAPSYPNKPSIADLPEEAVIRANAEKATTAADRPLSAFVEEEKAGLRAAGVNPENEKLQEYRSKIMAERANMDDEAKRQKNLRLAEFFASWGSTPGATLVAGMTALKKTIPTLIEDEKERKKAIREADKIIYDLDQADRLEKKGLGERASDKKVKASETAQKLNTELARSAEAKRRDEITSQGDMARFASQNFGTTTSADTSRYVADSSAASSKYAADLRLKGDQAHAAASAANAAAARDANNFNKAQTAYQLAQNARSMVDKEYDIVVNKDAYMRAKADVRDLSTNETPQIKARVEASRQYIEDIEKDFKARREMMDKSVRVAENRLNSISGGTVLPTTPTTATGIPETPPQGAVRLKSK
jgi:hypothetical protein